MAYEAGEIFLNTRVQKFTATADTKKGKVISLTPVAGLPTGAPCAEDGVGPFAVAIDTTTNGKTGRAVTKGEVSVDCSGNCYTGAVVTGSGGKVKVCDTDPSGNWIKPLGRMTVGGADGTVGVVDVGGF
jgi:hypothetical protein